MCAWVYMCLKLSICIVKDDEGSEISLYLNINKVSLLHFMNTHSRPSWIRESKSKDVIVHTNNTKNNSSIFMHGFPKTQFSRVIQRGPGTNAHRVDNTAREEP